MTTNEIVQIILCSIVLAGTIGFGTLLIVERKEIKRRGMINWYFNIKNKEDEN